MKVITPIMKSVQPTQIFPKNKFLKSVYRKQQVGEMNGMKNKQKNHIPSIST